MPSSPPQRNQERSILIVSCFLFIATAYSQLRRIADEKRKKEKSGRISRFLHVAADGDDASGSNVSSRCIRAIRPPIPYLESFLKCLSYPCDPYSRPDGFVILCMAENKLTIDLLVKKLAQAPSTKAAFSDPMVYCYNSFLGLPLARQAAAYFIAKRFMFPESSSLSTDQALSSINAEHVGVGSGAAGVLNSLFFLLGSEGDACLIPSPYYAAFESDMQVVAGIVPFGFHMANPTLGPTESELDLAYMEARSQGLNPKFILVTNPNNPLGTIYKPQVLLDIVSWARKRKLHTIVDELYALSTHQTPGSTNNLEGTNGGFQSIIQVLNNKLEDNVHWVWSVSKDFGASGLRVGYVYSQNAKYMKGLGNMNVICGVSHPIQMVISELLTDDQFIDSYLRENRERLRHSYIICIEKLEEMVLPFVPAEAGMFIYVDFSSLLPEKTMEWESRLSNLMIDYARVILTPGESQNERMPGMFRICYAWTSPEVLEIGMERLSRLVAKIRRMDWSDLNDVTLSGIC